MFGGRFAPSRSHLEEALALYDLISCRPLVRHAGPYPQVVAQGYLGVDLLCPGYPHQALVQSNAAIAEARRLAHPPSVAASLAIYAGLLLLSEDNAALDERVDQLIAVAIEQAMWRRGISLLRSGRRLTAPQDRFHGCPLSCPPGQGMRDPRTN